MKNQLTELFKKYPHLKESKEHGIIFEILIESEINGITSSEKMFRKYLNSKLTKIDHLR